MRKGIAVSPGVAVGTAYCIHEIFVNPDTQRLEDREVTAELARYETARDKVGQELRALQQKVERQVSHEAAAIFSVHEAILREAFGLEQVIWAYGHDPFDGTTGHIDGYARFVDEDTIAIGDTDWGAGTEDALATACEQAGFEVVRIDMPGYVDYMGHPMPAIYVNWLVVNGAVITTGFGVPAWLLLPPPTVPPLSTQYRYPVFKLLEPKCFLLYYLFFFYLTLLPF